MMNVLLLKHSGNNGYLLSIILLLFLACSCLAFASDLQTSNSSGESLTISNLQAAYAAEMSARSAYMEFAQKADTEGYKKVASLFRALSRAEQVHADTHLTLMKKMGIEPKMVTVQTVVKSTRENLTTALDDETRDAKEVYPMYADEAMKDGVKEASYGFKSAGRAEAVHVTLIQNLLNKPSSWSGKKMNWYVCPVCGNILSARLIACPICKTPGKKFIKIS